MELNTNQYDISLSVLMAGF